MNRTEFRELMAQKPLLVDGAMGSLLHEHGAAPDQSFDAINLHEPALVAGIHRRYIEAGADIIETNSFAANRFRLAEYGLQEQVAAINHAAVDIARRVIESAFRPVLLAGSVGPLGVNLAPLGRVTNNEAHDAFAEQVRALVQYKPVGVDLVIIETISDLQEIEAAVAAARDVSPTIPIVASMTFTRDDRTLLGHTAQAAANRLSQLDVDVIGVNCSGGPAQVLRLVGIMRQIAPEMPAVAMPNAGWPEQTEGGRMLYPAIPSYFANYAQAFIELGVRLVGGCCGTTDAHIAAMRQALDNPDQVTIRLPAPAVVTAEQSRGVVVDQPSQFERNLSENKLVVTVEMNPPRGVATQRLLAGAKMLKEAGANLLNIADAPLARMRMSAWAVAYLLQREVGLETVLHFPTRGRNLLRIQGDLLAAYAMGIRNLFVVMGDPTRIGDYPEATDSYDIVPTGLIQLIKRHFNQGQDKAGQPIDQATRFVVGCALNLTPHDPEREMKLLRKKIRSGADFALSQPVFDPEAARRFLEMYQSRYGELSLPIIAGIKPLFNSRNVEFLHNEVPGIHIPKHHRARMKAAGDPQQVGVSIAQEIVQQVQPFAQGIYLMPAFGRYDLVADVLDILSAG